MQLWESSLCTMMKRKDFFLVTQLLCWESKVHEVPNCTGSLRLGHQSYCKIQGSWKFAFYTKNTKLSYYFKLLTFEWKFHSWNNRLAFTINGAALFALCTVPWYLSMWSSFTKDRVKRVVSGKRLQTNPKKYNRCGQRRILIHIK